MSSGVSTERYRELFIKNPGGIYTIALDGTILDCNPAFATILGFEHPEELIGQNVIKHYFNADLREAFLTRILEEKEIENYEIALRTKTGQVIVCLENSFLLDGAGEDPTINGVIIEVTQERLISKKYEALFRASEDGVLFFTEGRLTDMNQRAIDMLEFSREELLEIEAAAILNHLKPENEDVFELLNMKIEKAKNFENQSIRIRIKRKEGSVFHARVAFHPFKVIDTRYTQIILSDISERVLFEQTIKESESRFRTLSKVAIEGIVFVHNNTITDCNDQILRMLGFDSRAKFIGKNLEDFILHPDMRRLRNTLFSSATSRSEIRAINLDGKIIHLEGSGTEIHIENKRLEAFLLYDISARKRTENELERSREQFKSLVENSPNGVWIVVDNRIRYVNQSGIRMLGYVEEDQLYSKDFTSLVPKPGQAGILKDFAKIRSGKEAEHSEAELICQDGSRLAVGINMTLSIYENEPAIQITINNLTLERQLLEQQLRTEMAESVNKELKREIFNHRETQRRLLAAQQFTRNIIDSSIDMIIAVDNESRVTEFNPAALKFFGYEKEEILNTKADSLYADARHYKRVLLSLNKNGAFRGEIKNKRKDGTFFTALLSASLIKGEDGAIIGSMGVSRDITELKEAQERIKESEERLRDIFSNSTDFILTFDNRGFIQFANKSFMETMQLDGQDSGTLNFFDMADHPGLESNRDPGAHLTEHEFRTTLITKAGDRIRVAGNVGVSHTEGRSSGYRAILRNVTRETEQGAKLNSIFESTENLHMWTLDRQYRLTGSNKNFLHVMKTDFGIDPKSGDNYLELITGAVNPDLYQNQLRAYKQAFSGVAQNFDLPLLNSSSENVWFQVFLNPVYIEDELQEISCIAYDITERKLIDRKIRDALKEKEVLLKEVHHRVKNNLQVISSILSLQTGFVKDQGTLEVLRESQNRIKSMSYIHETLYQTSDFSSIEFSNYISVISHNLIRSFAVESGPVRLETDLDELMLSLDQAIPCGLIANELITNALKHAFAFTEEPLLSVAVQSEGTRVSLTVRDNGVGLPPGFDYRNYDSLGVQLVFTLAEQLDAEVIVSSDAGACFMVTFERANT